MSPDIVTVGASWPALRAALRGNALAAFPPAAYERALVVHRLFGRRQYIVNSATAIRRILIDNAANYRRTATTTRVLRPIFGRGLFLAGEAEWKDQRRMLAPAFAARAVPILARHVAAAGQSLVGELAARAGRPVDLVPVFRRLALDIIGSAMFSLDMTERGAPLRRLIQRYAGRLGRPGALDFLLPLAVPSPRDLARRRFRRDWLACLGGIIAERRQRRGGSAPRDLFDLLDGASESGAGLAFEQLADHVATILVAGHDTTSAALFWSIHLLSTAAPEQARIAAEAASLDLVPEGAAEALPRLVRTRAVVDEALRLYPPAFVIVRRAHGDDDLDGVPVASGSLALVAPWVLHRHRRLWPAPETFDPDRFMPGAPPPDRFAYMPFGVGPRICIGAPFALSELVLIVAALVRAFRIEPAGSEPVRPTAIVTTRPQNPPLFALQPRFADPARRAA